MVYRMSISEMGLANYQAIQPPFGTPVGNYTDAQVINYLANAVKVIATLRRLLENKRYLSFSIAHYYDYHLEDTLNKMVFLQDEFQRRIKMRRNVHSIGTAICVVCHREFQRRPTSTVDRPVCYNCSKILSCEYIREDICVCTGQDKCFVTSAGTCGHCGACGTCYQRYQALELIA